MEIPFKCYNNNISQFFIKLVGIYSMTGLNFFNTYEFDLRKIKYF